jgi:shikimate dehydrogenase
LIGAVNTVVLKDGKRTGHNADASSFAAAFQRGLADARLDRVVQVGAGGAGCAVANAALGLGVRQLAPVDTAAGRAADLAAGLAEGGGRPSSPPDTRSGPHRCTPPPLWGRATWAA